MKPKLIIIEGAQGAGKTTLTDYIRNRLPYTNLYRLSGHSDSSEQGYFKSKKVFDALLEYVKALENSDVNLLFDRTFFSEEVYTRLGYKEYLFTPEYQKYVELLNSLDYEIYFIVLYLEDTENFKRRLNREGKAKVDYAKFDVTNSVNQQNMYLKLADEILESEYKNIHVLKIPNDTKNHAKSIIDELFIENK